MVFEKNSDNTLIKKQGLILITFADFQPQF